MSKFAVVIPAYNAETYLPSTIRSCLNLIVPEGSSLEIIIVDDGSTDGTATVAGDFKTVVKPPVSMKVIRKANGGESSAIMVGAESTCAEFLIFLSADDLLEPELLTEAKGLLTKDNRIVAVYPDWWLMDEQGKVISETKTHEWSYEEQFGKVENIPGPGSVIRSEAWRSAGGRNQNFHFYSDLEQWFRLATKGRLRRLPKTLAAWRTHDTNQSKTTQISQIAAEIRSLVYEFAHWDKDPIHQFHLSARVSTHLRLALLALEPVQGKLLYPRVNLALAMWCFLKILFTRGQQWVPGRRINSTEILLVLIHPFGRSLMHLKQSLTR